LEEISPFRYVPADILLPIEACVISTLHRRQAGGAERSLFGNFVLDKISPFRCAPVEMTNLFYS